jgi:glutathione S-transferase
MLQLYDYPASANCLKARVLLRHLEVEWERLPVDLFAGETLTDEYLAVNPAGRTPVLLVEESDPIAESGAILLYLAEGTPYLPDDRLERARVHQWLFFEQNLLEPNVGTARFWKLTGRDRLRPEVFEQKVEAGRHAIEVLERGLAGRQFLVGDRYGVADIALYAYTHVAGDAGIDMAPYRAVAEWLARIEEQTGFVNDLQPYPANAQA